MAAGRKAPPWRHRREGGPARGRRGVRSGLAQQFWFAASPLLLFATGRLSRSTFGAVVVDGRVGGEARDEVGRYGLGGFGGLGSGSFALWGAPVDDESFQQGEVVFLVRSRQKGTKYFVQYTEYFVHILRGEYLKSGVFRPDEYEPSPLDVCTRNDIVLYSRRYDTTTTPRSVFETPFFHRERASVSKG